MERQQLKWFDSLAEHKTVGADAGHPCGDDVPAFTVTSQRISPGPNELTDAWNQRADPNGPD
jgi:hypothetical protein